jgi:hypothetical protein
MWYVTGARISNDALAIPAFGLALLLAIDQLRRPAAEWRMAQWLLAGAAAAVGLAAKAYALAFLPVAAAAALIAAVAAFRGRSPWRPTLFPSLALVIVVAVNGWWLAENQARTGWIGGQNENATLAARGIVTLSDRVPFVSRLVFDEPRQLISVVARGSTQALYLSNWTMGAGPWWFYVLQLATLALVVSTLTSAPRTWTAPLRAAVFVAAIASLTIVAGSAKSVLDYFILSGETRLAQGYYVWAAGCSVAAALALAFAAMAASRRRLAMFLQATCLLVAVATDVMFWSGRYERHPVWRTPVRLESPTPAEPGDAASPRLP